MHDRKFIRPTYVADIKKYGNFYKLTITKPRTPEKNSSKDVRLKSSPSDNELLEKEKGRLENNISRARSRLLELTLCNHWDYFITFTIDGKKFDRTDLHGYYKRLSQWFRDYRKRYGVNIRYVLVPEFHRDGKSYHLHGLMADFEAGHIVPHMNQRNRKKGYFEFLPYTEAFGFNTFSPLKDPLACSLYMQKYITKDLSNTVTKRHAKMYYCSQKLNRAELVEKSIVQGDLSKIAFDYQNEYVSSTFSNDLAFLKSFL